ncbi:hypothetical protein ATCC90586_008819 [Pythium insidiosum]|nr:hypothetical protein ATCC90586_008819 [Pythium insidiosum]
MKLLQAVAATSALLSGLAAAERAVKQLYHVTLPKSALDTAFAKFGEELDVWKAVPLDDGNVLADVYVQDSTISKFRSIGKDVKIERDAVDTASYLAERATVRAACSTRTAGWLDDLPLATKYVDNAFFDCWRKPDEVYAFFDSLVADNPTIFSKIPQVTKTFEGRTVPGYKISTGSGKKSIYVQGLIHAREWHAGSTAYYSIASFLDGLRSGDASIKAIFDEYDYYIVPILNLDGHLWSWSNDRLWRKNRRPTGSSWWGGKTFGVDLNRNYGPAEFFGKGGDSKSSETYPGTAVLSEPETAGSFNFLSKLPNLKGAIDVHSYSGLVLRPFGNQNAQAPAPWGGKLKTLGDNVAIATMAGSNVKYTSQTAAELYLAYGTFTDAIFSVLNKTASVTFEMEGNSFVQPESAIRPAGQRVFNGIVQFIKELKAYYS